MCIRDRYKPTKITDKNGKITEFTYDQHGNILTIKRPRGTVTTFTYDYTVFPLGRLTSVQESGKPAATITYFEPSGLAVSYTHLTAGDVISANSFGANGLVSRRNGTTSEFYLFDPQGSAVENLDTSGTVLSHSLYDAYGNRLNLSLIHI